MPSLNTTQPFVILWGHSSCSYLSQTYTKLSLSSVSMKSRGAYGPHTYKHSHTETHRYRDIHTHQLQCWLLNNSRWGYRIVFSCVPSDAPTKFWWSVSTNSHIYGPVKIQGVIKKQKHTNGKNGFVVGDTDEVGGIKIHSMHALKFQGINLINKRKNLPLTKVGGILKILLLKAETAKKDNYHAAVKNIICQDYYHDITKNITMPRFYVQDKPQPLGE